MVRPRHVSLYVAMNKYRMLEPYQSGQLGDVIVALEKYHDFGFSYDGQAQQVAVSAVWGDKDSLIPQRAIDCFANQIRDIRLKILEGEGHDLIWKDGVMAWAIRSIGERWRAAEKQ
jgi:pimeloyl-ACP methyl ester carboxylesterase